MSIKSKDQYGRDRDQWPVFRTEGAENLIIHIKNYIKYLRDRELPVVLCFYFHPWEFIEMPKGLIQCSPEGKVLPDEYLIKNCGDYSLAQLEKIIDELKSIGSIFMEAGELAERWTEINSLKKG